MCLGKTGCIWISNNSKYTVKTELHSQGEAHNFTFKVAEKESSNRRRKKKKRVTKEDR